MIEKIEEQCKSFNNEIESDKLKIILEKYEFFPEFIPSTKDLFAKKSKLFCEKSVKVRFV